MSKTHGHASAKNTVSRTYRSWYSMLTRCRNRNFPRFSDYGGRGIKVCERWHSFENFLADMGERPLATSLDRFPHVDGNYEMSNCRWATREQQARNTRVSKTINYNGKSLCLAEWSEITGIKQKCLSERLIAGWSIEDTLTKPPAGNHHLLTYKGKTQDMLAWSKELGIGYYALSHRFTLGWTVEEALSTPPRKSPKKP